MKVEGTKGPLAPAVTRPARRRTDAGPAASVRIINDTTSIMGIPESDLTPKVRTALMRLMKDVAELRTELERGKRRMAELERLADQDSLLPVANRRAFVRELSRVITFTERYGTTNSVLFFDINGMKKINDTFGHATGDLALQRVAKILLENVRESDMVGRLGGDEFGIMLAQSDQAQANEKASSLAALIEKTPLVHDGKEVKVTMAYGAYVFRGGEDPGDALAAADKAMYANKRRK